MKESNVSPIAVFTYNRPGLLMKTIEALKINDYALKSDLIIFSDGSKGDSDRNAVNEVRAYLKIIEGFKSIEVIERERNYGLSVSIIDGVNYCIQKYGRIIVLEDDLITSPYFLKYMNEALDLYEDDEDVISVQGYVYPTTFKMPDYFFIKGADCQGWATWKRGWDLFESDGFKLLAEIDKRGLKKEFNFDNNYPYHRMLRDQIRGKKNSWAIRWYASAFLYNKYTLYPGKTLVYNSGFGEDGTNTSNKHLSELFNSSLNMNPVELKKITVSNSPEGMRGFIDHFQSLQYWRSPSRFMRKLIEKISSL